MMRKLFDIVNPNFFSVLSSPNKEIYCECLFKIYDCLDSLNDDFQSDKTTLIHRLIDFFDGYKTSIKEDDDVATTGRDKANLVLKKLRDCGWIGEEFLGDNRVNVHFFDYSLSMMEVLEKICYGRGEDYSRDIFEIYASLNSFEIDNALDVLITTFQKTKSLITKLKNLKANIYRYYFDICNNKSADELKDTLKNLLEDYKNEFFDKSYFTLKTKDSLHRHKRTILKRIAAICASDSKLDYLANLAIEAGKKTNYDDAHFYVEEMVRFIEHSFSKLDNLMAQIDRRNEQYVNAATSKILFLTSDGTDVKSLLNRFLRAVIKDQIKEEQINNIIHFSPTKNLDNNSLYTPRTYTLSAKSNELVTFTEEELEWIRANKMSNLILNVEYSFPRINDYASSLLREFSEIEAKDVTIIASSDYIKLILLFIYSRNEKSCYICESKKEFVTNNFAYFQNFIIRRKS